VTCYDSEIVRLPNQQGTMLRFGDFVKVGLRKLLWQKGSEQLFSPASQVTRTHGELVLLFSSVREPNYFGIMTGHASTHEFVHFRRGLTRLGGNTSRTAFLA